VTMLQRASDSWGGGGPTANFPSREGSSRTHLREGEHSKPPNERAEMLLSRNAFPLHTLNNHPVAPVLLRMLQLNSSASRSQQQRPCGGDGGTAEAEGDQSRLDSSHMSLCRVSGLSSRQLCTHAGASQADVSSQNSSQSVGEGSKEISDSALASALGCCGGGGTASSSYSPTMNPSSTPDARMSSGFCAQQQALGQEHRNFIEAVVRQGVLPPDSWPKPLDGLDAQQTTGSVGGASEVATLGRSKRHRGSLEPEQQPEAQREQLLQRRSQQQRLSQLQLSQQSQQQHQHLPPPQQELAQETQQLPPHERQQHRRWLRKRRQQQQQETQQPQQGTQPQPPPPQPQWRRRRDQQHEQLMHFDSSHMKELQEQLLSSSADSDHADGLLRGMPSLPRDGHDRLGWDEMQSRMQSSISTQPSDAALCPDQRRAGDDSGGSAEEAILELDDEVLEWFGEHIG